MQPCDAVGTVEGGSEGAVKRVLIATVFIACRRHTSHRPRQQKPSCSHQYSIRLLSDQVYGHSTARAPACVCVCVLYIYDHNYIKNETVRTYYAKTDTTTRYNRFNTRRRCMATSCACRDAAQGADMSLGA